MTTKSGEKDFDALKFKDEAQARLQEETRDLTPAEEIQLIHDHALNGPLGEWWKRLQEADIRRRRGNAA